MINKILNDELNILKHLIIAAATCSPRLSNKWYKSLDLDWWESWICWRFGGSIDITSSPKTLRQWVYG